MKASGGLAVCAALSLLVGCDGRPIADEAAAAGSRPVGSDRDAHGCIASAGYRWCAMSDACERPWELAERAGIEATPEAFTAYCSAAE